MIEERRTLRLRQFGVQYQRRRRHHVIEGRKKGRRQRHDNQKPMVLAKEKERHVGGNYNRSFNACPWFGRSNTSEAYQG